MKTITIKNTTIGEGIPKVCVPIVETTRPDILKAADRILHSGADIVEWRADWYEDIFDLDAAAETAAKLREALKDLPLLFTFRTLREGGEKAIDPDQYAALNQRIAADGCADLIDVELFTGDELVKSLIQVAHDHGVKVILSNHDFKKTPPKTELLYRLRKMQDLGADIPKIAVMPQNKRDVLTLLSATEEMATDYADRPIITMSMAGNGMISRLSGEVFGSSITFGAVGKTSAPGQIAIEDLKNVLTLIHENL